MNTTPEQRLAAAKRELGLRKQVYPGLMLRGKMGAEKATHELAVMGDIIEVLEALVAASTPAQTKLFPRVNEPCTLQHASEEYVSVEATETPEGLDLHSFEEEPDPDPDEDPAIRTYWGRLSLRGWETLVEMFALRHPKPFGMIVDKWQRLTKRHA